MSEKYKNFLDTKRNLIQIQYQSFTDNERKREATVLQFVAVIIAILAGYGFLLKLDSFTPKLILGYSFISNVLLIWISAYIINSTYQYRSQQHIQSKIREVFGLHGTFIPEEWNNLRKPNGKLFTNYYFWHLIIITFINIINALMPSFIFSSNHESKIYRFIYIFYSHYAILSQIGFSLFYWNHLKNELEAKRKKFAGEEPS